MKKLLLSVAIAGLAGSAAFAQGTVNMQLVSGVTVTTNGFNSSSQAVTGNTAGTSTYMYEVLVDTATTSGTYPNTAPSSQNPLSAGWADSGVSAVNATDFINGSASATSLANTFAENEWTYYEIVGWSTDNGLYTSWSTVKAALSNGLTGAGLANGAYYGISNLGDTEPGGGSPALGTPKLMGLVTSENGQTPLLVQSFVLNEVLVPEPGTLALAAIGGASLLMFRRKK